jgi:AcrR family transcriptional regulator
MSESTKPRRTYSSTRRRSQAEQTRAMILNAAGKLFFERGYAGTTMEAIAQQAGVAPETVYAAFGSKGALLHRLVDVTLVGDEQPVPLLERPAFQEALRETDAGRLIDRFAKDMYAIMSRMSPLFALLRATAPTDPETAALRSRLLSERLNGMSVFVEQLRRSTPLREGILQDQAAASVWALSSAEVFDLLTRDLGWSEDQYAAWIGDALRRVLLP